MSVLQGYGVEPLALRSGLSRSVLGEDFPRAVRGLWGLLENLPEGLWTGDVRADPMLLAEWRTATGRLRGCLDEHLPAFRRLRAIDENLPKVGRARETAPDECPDPKAPYMPATWYTSKFGIPADRLRSARRTGRLAARDISNGGKRPYYHYSVPDARRLWPEDGIYLPEDDALTG